MTSDLDLEFSGCLVTDTAFVTGSIVIDTEQKFRSIFDQIVKQAEQQDTDRFEYRLALRSR